MTCLREQQQQRGQQAQVGLGPSTHLFLFFTQSGVDARATAARVYPCTWTVGDRSPATVCTDASTTTCKTLCPSSGVGSSLSRYGSSSLGVSCTPHFSKCSRSPVRPMTPPTEGGGVLAKEGGKKSEGGCLPSLAWADGPAQVPVLNRF